MEKSIKKYFPVFALPTLVAFTIGFIIPFIMGIYLSFCEFTTVTDAKFVGLKNYIRIFSDATFTHALVFTALFTVVSVLTINVFAFAIAMLLTKGIRGTNLFRTVFFMPNLIGGIVLGYIWQILLNGILANFGKTLTYSGTYGFWGLVILMNWQQIGYMMIIYIAGIQNIPGDEVLVVEPAYVSYIPCVELCGGIPVSIPLQAKNRFRLTAEELEEKITERTKVLLISFPNNPTGAIMEKADLEAIREVVLAHDLFVITDEIYAELTYGKKHVSIAALPDMYERCVVLNGFSKAFAMTGWRMGIAAGPAEVIFHMNKIHQFTTMSAGTTSQYAALEALTSPVRDEEIDVMRQEYDERRHLMVDGFRAMGLKVVEPEGAFYVFPSIKETGLSSMECCRRLLQEQKVAVIPGDAFGSCGEGYIRCSYAYSKDVIKECLEKIAVFVAQFDLNKNAQQ